MQNTPRFRRHTLRVLQFFAALGLSASALAAPSTPGNSVWSELRSAALVTCPQDVPLPRPLVAAAACGDRYRVHNRIMAGADLSATDHRPALAGRTALHHAAQRGDAAMAALLLDAGADPNATDTEGNTPLHLLAGAPPSAESVDLAKSLLAYGADATRTNARGRTPVRVLEVTAGRTISPLRLDRSGLKTLLQQAEATGPVRTAEPGLPQRQAAAEPASSETTSETAQAVSEATGEAATVATEAAPAEVPSEAAPAATAAASAPADAPPVEAAAPAEAPKETAAAPAPDTPAPEPAAEAPKAAPVAEAPAPAEAVEPPPPAKPRDTTEADLASVRTTLDHWASAWSSGDPEAYLKHYSRHFVPADGNSLEGWKAQRRARVEKPETIRVALTDIDISLDGDKAVARFVQDYQSDSYKVVNAKQITFGREGRSWRIVDERTVD